MGTALLAHLEEAKYSSPVLRWDWTLSSGCGAKPQWGLTVLTVRMVSWLRVPHQLDANA